MVIQKIGKVLIIKNKEERAPVSLWSKFLYHVCLLSAVCFPCDLSPKAFPNVSVIMLLGHNMN